MKSVDRRSAERVAVSVPTDQYVEGQTHRCRASNLSLSGVYIERPIATFVRHSTSVAVDLSLPDGVATPLRAEAEIVYDCFDATSHGSALRFTSMSGADRARLAAFLRRAPNGSDPTNARAA